jgi:WD40 repeat protein
VLHRYLNRSVACDKSGVYKITTTAYVAAGADGGRHGAGGLACKVQPLKITLRAGDPKKRAATIQSLIQAYRSGRRPPEEFKRHADIGDCNENLRFLMLYRDSSVIPLFLDVLEKARGSSDDGSYYALIGLDGMPDREQVLRAFEERLEHPEKHNTPALVHEYLHHAGPAEQEELAPNDWRSWKHDTEITHRFHAKALRLLRQDKEYRYAYLVPGLVGGSEDAFLVDYLLRCKRGFDFVNGAWALQRVQVAREHLPVLESILPRTAGYSHIADAVIIQLVSMDRKRYLPELAKDPERFSPEIRKLLEEDIDAEEERLMSRIPRMPGKDLRGEHLPQGAIAHLGTLALRVQSPVTGLAFAPDGKTFTTAGHDGIFRIWDTATGKELRQIKEHHQGVFALQLTPDGKTLIAAGERGTIQVLDLAARLRKPAPSADGIDFGSGTASDKQMSASARAVYDLAVSPDGKLLVSRSADHSVHLWEVATAKLRHELHRYRVAAVAFHPEGRTVAMGSQGDGVLLFDAETGKVANVLGAGKLPDATALLFAPDGKSLFTGSSDGALRCWDIAARSEVRSFAPATKAPVLAAALSRDGRWLAAVYEGKAQVVLWETATGQEVRRFELSHGVPYTVAFSPDGQRLAAAGTGPLIGLWEVATGRECCPAAGKQASLNAVAFGPDSRTLASGNDDGTIQLWDAVTGKLQRTVGRAPEAVTHLCFADGSKSLLTLGPTLRRWEVSSGKQVSAFPAPVGLQLIASRFSADGARVANAYANGEVRVRDTRGGQERLAVRSAHPYVALSGDGKILAITEAAPANRVRLLQEGAPENLRWLDVDTGKSLGAEWVADAKQFTVPVQALLIAPQRRSLITALPGQRITLWETATGSSWPLGTEQWNIPYAVGGLTLAVAPNGKTLAVAEHTLWNASGDGKYGVCSYSDTVALWDLTTGRRVQQLQGQGQVTDLAFSPDSALLAARGQDTTVMIWDLRDLLPNQRVVEVALTAEDLQELWSKLGSKKMVQAYPAMAKLAQAPRQTVELLRAQLKPVAPSTQDRLTQLVADLGSDRFAVRERATQELFALGELAMPALRAQRAGAAPLEVHRRVDALLQLLAHWSQSPARLQRIRAVAVLEGLGTVEAKRLLDVLAGGAAQAELTTEARAALERLSAK